MPVATLRLRITSTWAGGDSNVGRQLGEAMGATGRGIGRGLRSVVSSLRSLARPSMLKVAVALAPALFTLAKHTLALVGGITALGVVVGAAVAPWIGLAVTAARNADKMGAAGERFQTSAKRVGDAWMKLARDTAPQTLGPVTDVLNGIAAAIPKLDPLVRDISPAFAQMGRDIQAWLQGPGLERFLQNVQDYGVPAFRNLADAGRDFMATVGIGFRQFLPLARDIGETLRRGADRLRNFGKGGGFARFLNEIKREGPAVNRALEQIARLFDKLAGLVNGAGEGGINALGTAMDLFNRIDPDMLRDIVLGLATFKGIAGLAQLLAALAAFRAAGMQVAGGAALTTSGGELTSAAGPLFALAGRVSTQAANQARRAADAAGGRNVNRDALTRIKEIWDNLPKNARTTFAIPSVNTVAVGLMGVNSTWVTLQTNFANPANFRVELNASLFYVGALIITFAWAGVLLSALLPALMTAVAMPGTVPLAAFSIITAWGRVRTAAASPPRFSASGNAGPVTSGANTIINAWRRVTSMPKTWAGTARVNPGNVVGASGSIVSSWRRVLGMARTWHGVATCSFSGGFSGISGPGGASAFAGARTSGSLIDGGRQDLQGGVGPGGIFKDGAGRGPKDAPPDDYGSIDMPDYSISDPEVNPGGTDSGSWFNPDDFEGSGNFATGGPVGFSAPSRKFSTGLGGGGRHVHIYEDVRVRNARELADLLESAIDCA